MAEPMGGGVAGIAADADTMTEAVVYFATPAWSALLDWLEFHGINPRMIPAGTLISRDACGRCIRYLRIVTDDDGRRRHEPHGAFVTVPAVEQGEAAPLPYPPEVAELLAPSHQRHRKSRR